MEPTDITTLIVIRDNLQDQGEEPSKNRFQSPDILVSRERLTEAEILAFKDFTKDFSQGLPKPEPSQPSPPKSDISELGLSEPGQTNFVYLRGRLNVNRRVVNVNAKLYTIPVNASGILSAVELIGASTLRGVEGPGEFVIETPIEWNMGSSIEGEVAHYYLIASVAISGDPHPNPNRVKSPRELLNFLRKNSNVAVQNFITLNLLPGGKSKGPFFIQGASDLVIDPTDLPDNSEVAVKLTKAFTKTTQFDETKVKKKASQPSDTHDWFLIQGIQKVTIEGTPLGADEKFVAEIEVKIPTGTDDEIKKYTVRISQKQGDEIIGCINVHARVIGLNNAKYLGSISNHLIEESTYIPYRMANRDFITPFLNREEARLHGFDWGPNTLNEIFTWVQISYRLGRKIQGFIGSVEDAQKLVDDIRVTRFVGKGGRLRLAVRVAESIIDIADNISGIFELLESIQKTIKAKNQSLDSFVDLVNSCKVDFHEFTRPSVPTSSDENPEVAQGLLDSLFDSKTGAQKEYFPHQSEEKDVSEYVENVLTQYGRVWVYSQGIALHQAARKYDESTDQQTKKYYKFRADKLMDWLFEHEAGNAKSINKNGNEEPVRGWHFSENTSVTFDPKKEQDELADPFKDPRLVTGANAWALNGVARYLTSGVLGASEEDRERKTTFKRFYEEMLDSLLGHQKPDGLFSAGWDFYILQHIEEDEQYIKDHIESDAVSIYKFLSDIVDLLGFDPSQDRKKQMESIKDTTLLLQFQKIGDIILNALDYNELLLKIKNNSITNPKGVRNFLSLKKLKGRSYNKILGIAGYEDADFYPDKETRRPWYDRVPNDDEGPRHRVMAKNVVTEHNLDMLAVLNFAIDHACALGLSGQKRIKLLEHRGNLRKAIFTRLYDPVKKRFITGRGPDGSPSRHTAIDNASWLALSANLRIPEGDGVRPGQRERLANGLFYTIKNFTQNISYQKVDYFGAHYFEPDFNDPYVEKAPFGAQKDVYHIEATTGLILGLEGFKKAYPTHKFVQYFDYKSRYLWSEVQRFSTDHGFIYGTKSIQDLFEPLESSTTAIWYIDTHDKSVGEYDPEVQKPDPPNVKRGEVITLYDEYLRCPYSRWGKFANAPMPNIEVNANSTKLPRKASNSLKISYTEKRKSDACGITLTFLNNFRNDILLTFPKSDFLKNFDTGKPSSNLLDAIKKINNIPEEEELEITITEAEHKRTTPVLNWYLEGKTHEFSYSVFADSTNTIKFFRKVQGVSLEHASKLTFYARASRKGMRVDFSIGSEISEKAAYFDSAGTGGTENGYVISKTWKSYEIPLNAPNRDWSDINELFIITFKRKSFGGPDWGSGKIWLDKIKFVSV